VIFFLFFFLCCFFFILPRWLAPGHTHDAAAGINKLLTTFSPENFILVGHSCGAHMAALLWLDESFGLQKLPSYCVGIEGLYNLPLFCQDFSAWRGEVEVSQSPDEEMWKDPSRLAPTSETQKAVRWLIMHAPADAYVNLAQPEYWATRLAEWGVTRHCIFTLPKSHFDGVRDRVEEVERRIIGEIRRLMEAAEEPLAGRDEERRMKAAGYRVYNIFFFSFFFFFFFFSF
jgi:acetyl esterase/lipase